MENVIIKYKHEKIIIMRKVIYPEGLNEKSFTSLEKMTGIIQLKKKQKGKKMVLLTELENSRSLKDYIKEGIQKEQFLDIIIQMIRRIKECKELGLSETNLEMRMDRIFVDPYTCDIRCIYWPVSNLTEYMTPADFFETIQYEAEFKPETNLQFLYEYNDYFESKVPFSLKNFERMVSLLSGMELQEDRATLGAGLKKVAVKETIAYIQTVDGHRTKVEKAEFIIGKSQAGTDMMITGNSSVSRRHARIICRGGQYYIEDLNSLNGTYVNESKVEPGISKGLHTGDKIKVSDTELIFYIV